jgi:predicted nucleic acid-binding protein
LIDERISHAKASPRAIPVVGVLGVLREGSRPGFIADPLAGLAAMRISGFRISKRLLDEFQEGIAMISQGRATGS